MLLDEWASSCTSVIKEYRKVSDYCFPHCCESQEALLDGAIKVNVHISLSYAPSEPQLQRLARISIRALCTVVNVHYRVHGIAVTTGSLTQSAAFDVVMFSHPQFDYD